MSDDFSPRRSCAIKVRFPSRQAAKHAARFFGLGVYRCLFCGDYHVGHTRGHSARWRKRKYARKRGRPKVPPAEDDE